ncbi:MAG: hypothetical protein ACTHNT_09290 [Actinomycetales bacterium]
MTQAATATEHQPAQRSPWRKIDLLVIAFPLAIAADVLSLPSAVVFVLGALAVIPLAGIIGRATESLAEKSGGTMGALLNATFGNVAEFAIAALLVIKGEVDIVKASIVGSLVGNLLLLLGVSIVLSSYDTLRVNFHRTSRVQATSLFLVVGIFLLPTLFSFRNEASSANVGEVSDAIAIVLVGVYVLSLVFTMKTHREVFEGGSNDDATAGQPSPPSAPRMGVDPGEERGPQQPQPGEIQPGESQSGESQPGESQPGQATSQHSGWSTPMAIAVLAVATVLVAIAAEIVAGSVEDAGKSLGLTGGFLGFVILPLVGNAAEQFSAVALAAKDRLDVAADISIGASMQVCTLIVPLLVVVGLITGHHFTLVFEAFELAVLVVGTLLIRQLVDDRKSNWFEGVILLALYLAFAVSAFFVHI